MKSAHTPTYWGSFGALAFTLGTVALASVYQSNPSPAPSTQRPLFYLSLGLVLLFTVRYYSATAIDIYSSGNTYMLPKKPRKTLFFGFVLLVFLCGISVGLVGSFGTVWAIIACCLMSIISLICAVVLWTTAEMGLKHKINPGFTALVDVFYFLIAGWSALNLWNPPTDTKSSSGPVLGFVVAIAIVLFLLITEFQKIYLREFKTQIKELRQALNKEDFARISQPQTDE